MNEPQRKNYRRHSNYPTRQTNLLTPSAIKRIAANGQTNKEEKTSDPHEKIINTNDTKWSKADLIALGMLVVTAILAIYTYALYKNAVDDSTTAKTSSKAATDAAQIAQKTFKETKEYNDSSLRVQEKSYRKSVNDSRNQESSNERTEKRQNISVNAQMNSLQETQKEFEIENRPFIAIGNLTTEQPEIGKVINFTAAIGNAGKQPAFIRNCAYEFIFTSDSSFNNMKNIHRDKSIVNSYISNNQTIPIMGHTNYKIDTTTFNNINKNKFFLYLRGIISYRGFLKKINYKISFIYKIEAQAPHYATTVYYRID